MKQTLSEGPWGILFVCRSRECGSSAQWANTIFKERTLYGPDREQSIIVARQMSPSLNYRIFYMVRRGNKRLMLHVVQLTNVSEAVVAVSQQQASQQTVEVNAWYYQLQEFGFVPVDIDFDREVQPQGDQLQKAAVRLAQLLTSYPNLTVGVVGHSTRSDAEQSVREGKKAADSLLKIFTENHQQLANRLSVHSVGKLAPRAEFRPHRFERIELVLLN